ncbi:hypothetical protein GCM10008982_16940 [Anoxybacillus voinovskiensis]|uniref:DUF4231 domain-containing protein n=1 Tax=Anoxybacteroides voinovskiense TaxID=230470 RepID=UPI0016059026|nr:DUF4231 domain-containing protein [Anoxybacillus voinovskiensis]GGJ68222.1 hypothetical protein GCM10008982_16940 [Anoxybacillus voinovskiensis]
MSVEEYINGRLTEQINWYDKKSMQAKKRYMIFQTIEIISASLIPIVNGLVTESAQIRIIISILGSIVVICGSLARLGKFHENWLHYRQTCELLKHEKYLFLTSTTPYEEQSFQLLVERVESIISSENVNWSQLATEKREEMISR